MPFSGWGELDKSFAERLQALIRAAGGRVWVNSGYRSVQRQRELWDAAVKKYGSAEKARKWVAPPGRSNHNHGIAADLGGDLRLAARLAPKFGLRFPMAHEPWHIEPIGARSKSKGGHDHDPDHEDARTPTPEGFRPPRQTVHDVFATLDAMLAAPPPDPGQEPDWMQPAPMRAEV